MDKPDLSKLQSYPWPGKFEGGLLINPIAWELAGHGGPDKEVSWPMHMPEEWAGLMYGPFKREDYEGCDPDVVKRLNEHDRRYLETTAGCIIHCDARGFVSVEWYEDREEMEADWERIEESFSEPDPSEHEDEPEW